MLTPLSEVAHFSFWSQMMRNVPKQFFQFWIFLNYGYAHPPLLRSGHICMTDAHCTDSDEKSIF